MAHRKWHESKGLAATRIVSSQMSWYDAEEGVIPLALVVAASSALRLQSVLKVDQCRHVPGDVDRLVLGKQGMSISKEQSKAEGMDGGTPRSGRATEECLDCNASIRMLSQVSLD